MKTLRSLLLFLTFSLLVSPGFAAEANPAGLWKWTVQGRQGGTGFEQSLRLAFADGKLTGTLLGVRREQFQVPDTAISDASFEGGTVKFSVTRELNGTKFTTKYEGTLNGDTIKGFYERAGMGGGEAAKREWEARRAP